MVLTQSISATADDDCLNIPAGKAVTLDLNGHTLDGSACLGDSLMYIGSEAALTLADSAGGGALQYHAGDDAWLSDVVYVAENAELVMTGGAIESSGVTYATGVYVDYGGHFTMSGGAITCTGVNSGGVYICGDAIFAMTGGTITGNDRYGVYSETDFSISGDPVVEGNGEVNVFLDGECVIHIAGPLTEGARIGVALVSDTGVFTDVLSGNGTAQAFTSDNGAYVVRTNDEGEALLKAREWDIAVVCAPQLGQISGPAAASEGEAVELTLEQLPEDYRIRSASVKAGESGQEIAFTQEDMYSIAFTMPGENVTVSLELVQAVLYDIHIGAFENGRISAQLDGQDVSRAAEGEHIDLVATSGEGYALMSLSVTQGHSEVPVANGAFTMPAGDVTVEAVFGIKAPNTIYDEADWNAFADAVESGGTSGETWTLAADIAVSRTVGTQEHPFDGVFEGGGHTLTAAISDTDSQGTAPFRYISGAILRDLTVEGSVNGTTHAAGLVGFNWSGESTLENCTVNAAVTVSSDSNCHMGGVLGHNKSAAVTMKGVVFGGTMQSTSDYAGGLVGWSDDSSITLEDCLFKGSCSGGASFNPVACKNGSNTVSATVTRVYYTAAATLTGGSNLATTSGALVSASAPDNAIYSVVTAADGLDYFLPCRVDGLKKTYSYTTGLSYQITNGDGGPLEKGTDYQELLMLEGQPASSLSREGIYDLTLSGLGAYRGTIAHQITVMGPIPYVDAAGTEYMADDFEIVEPTMTQWPTGWYAVTGDTDMPGRITTNGRVNLILCDGAVLNVPRGITLVDGNSLTIWAQRGGTGELHARGYTQDCAAIGGEFDQNAGALTVNGGVITATGAYMAAGIGGGNEGFGGTVTINGGYVEARGGDEGAGIGGGSWLDGGTVTINGGYVKTYGGSYAAGIGSGRIHYGNHGGGTLVIHDGGVMAWGGYNSAGIGAGYGGSGDRGTMTLDYSGSGEMRVYSSGYGTRVNLKQDYLDFDDETTVYAAADNIDTGTISGKTIVPGSAGICHITFDAGEGSGSMNPVKIGGNGEYTLPDVDFTAPEGKRFRIWSVVMGDAQAVEKAPKENITVTADTTVTAVWEDIPVITISGVTGSFNDRIKLNYYFDIPDAFLAD